jgi:hypothetical protein
MISDEALMGYLDGHVDPDRGREIEVALAKDPALRTRLASLEETDRSIRAAFDSLLDSPTPDRLIEAARAGRLAHGIPAADNVVSLRPAARPGGLMAPLGAAASAARKAWRETPSWVGLAAAAQIGLLVAGAALFQGPLLTKPAPAAGSYHALGAAPDPAAINVMVMFRPDTPEHGLREALRDADARIVDGPTAAGAYLLHVPASDRAARLVKLRRRPEVQMAEPVDSAGAPR